jgi:hypothetical protein
MTQITIEEATQNLYKLLEQIAKVIFAANTVITLKVIKLKSLLILIL